MTTIELGEQIEDFDLMADVEDGRGQPQAQRFSDSVAHELRVVAMEVCGLLERVAGSEQQSLTEFGTDELGGQGSATVG